MASLNTLRTKGGVILTIVIGIALLAFLLGDLASPGKGILNNDTSVGQINDNKVDYHEYGLKADQMIRVAQLMSNTQSLSSEQTDQARDMAWEALIIKYSYMPGFEKMGITASDAEQADMVSGRYVSPVLQNFFMDRSTGQYSPEMFRSFVTNKEADPNSMALWNYITEQMISHRLMSKYISLFNRGLYTNALEVEQGVQDANNTYNARYIVQSYNTIPDSIIKISDSQIKKYYSDHKQSFQQVASRNVEYVLFDMLPSEADYTAASELISTMANEFAASVDPMQYARANSQQSPDQRYVKADAIEKAIADVVLAGDKKGVYGPALAGDVYTMARLSDTRMIPDSLGAKYILLNPTDVNLADSLLSVLRKGGNFEALNLQYSIDKQNPGGDMGVFTPEQMLPEISEACIKANKGDYFTVNTQNGLFVMKLTHKTAAVTKYLIATLTYNVEPSAETEQVIYGQASAFLSSASGSVAKFNAAVTDAGLSKRVGRIRTTDRNVTGLENSRELVRWAFNAKKGAVSGIMEIDGDYVIANLIEIREEGIATVAQASNEIRSILVRKEKARMISEKMTGTSLNAVASTLGTQVADMNGVQQSAFFVESIGVEPAVIGAVCASKPEQLSKPVEGLAGVFLFTVTGITQAENATPESEKVRLEAMSQSYLAERLNQAMVKESKVTDSRVKYF